MFLRMTQLHVHTLISDIRDHKKCDDSLKNKKITRGRKDYNETYAHINFILVDHYCTHSIIVVF